MRKIAIALLLCLNFISGFAAEFVAGKDYEVMADDSNFQKELSTKVVEFFSFGCPWCYRVEEPLNAWHAKQAHPLPLQKIPVVFKKEWELYAKAYYIAKALNLSDKIDPALFQAILKEKQNLSTTDALVNFFVKQGVDKALIESALTHSTAIDMELGTGQALMAYYHINAIPAFVVRGRYKTDLEMAKNPARLLEILTYLSELKA